MTTEQRRLAAIVSADVAGYSRLMGRDESGTLALARLSVMRTSSASTPFKLGVAVYAVSNLGMAMPNYLRFVLAGMA